jgi:tRNA nucleotidyltransferase (CCA-adding enzyme)
MIRIEALGDVWSLKPIIKGLELAQLLGIKPGPELKKRTNELIEWQIDNPIGTADDYARFIEESHGRARE